MTDNKDETETLGGIELPSPPSLGKRDSRVELSPKSATNFTWDYVMVFDRELDSKRKRKQERYSKKTREVINVLRNAGLQTTEYLSVQKDEVYCLIGAPNERLREEAHRIEYDLLLDGTKALEKGVKLDLELAQHTRTTKKEDHRTRFCVREAWNNLYCKYDKIEEAHEIYRKYTDEGSQHEYALFTAADRLKLTISIIEAELEFGGADLAVGKLIHREKDHPLLACFPLHQNAKKKELENEWGLIFQPLDKIRRYFGEYFALYFAFLSFYNLYLLFPAVIGGYYFWKQFASGSPDVDGIWLPGIIISLWGAMFLEFWKRRESTLRARWGQTNFLQKEQPRPEFEGELIFSPIDGSLVEYFSWGDRFKRVMFSQFVVVTMSLAVVACVMSIFMVQKLWSDWEHGAVLVGVLSAVQIMVGNAIYSVVSEKLTIRENHQTDSKYENALIAKMFVFKFVNSYNSLFYIAFFKKYHVGCPNEDGEIVISGLEKTGDDFKEGSCLSELRIQLGTIFISMIVLNNLLEWFVPVLKTKHESRKQASEDKRVKKTDPELQFELAEYADNESTFSDYDELIIQFGYVTMFFISFPLTPLLAILNNIIEVWLDSRKLTRVSRRPEPRGVHTIGTWGAILEILIVLTVLTNVGLAVFETKSLARLSNLDVSSGEDYSFGTKFLIFFVTEHVILAIKFTIQYFIPDEPEDTTNHVLRQEYIARALVHRIKDKARKFSTIKILQHETEMDYDRLQVGYEVTEHFFNDHAKSH